MPSGSSSRRCTRVLADGQCLHMAIMVAAFALFGGTQNPCFISCRPCVSRWRVCHPSPSSPCFDAASRGLVPFTVIPTVSPWATFFRTSGPEAAFVSVCVHPWLKLPGFAVRFIRLPALQCGSGMAPFPRRSANRGCGVSIRPALRDPCSSVVKIGLADGNGQ
jgi:hypothetical protein